MYTPKFIDGTEECLVCGEITERECRHCGASVCKACAEEHGSDKHRSGPSLSLTAIIRHNPRLNTQQVEVLKGLFPSSVAEVSR